YMLEGMKAPSNQETTMMGPIAISAILVDGAFLCLIIGIFTLSMLYLKPRLMINEFPKEIQDHVPPLNGAEKTLATIFGGAVLAIFFGNLAFFSIQLRAANGGSVSFMTAFV